MSLIFQARVKLFVVLFILLMPFGQSLAGNACQVDLVKCSPANTLNSIPGLKGKIVKTLKWKDQGGEFVLVITQMSTGEPGLNLRSELYAYLLNKVNSRYKQVWKVYDFADDSLSSLSLNVGSVKIIDLDCDGWAEALFSYAIIKDGLDPNPMKLMLFTKGKKLAIRGVIPKHEDDLNRYEKKFDKTFSQYPRIFKDFASKEWDIVAKKELESYGVPADGVLRK